MALSDAIAFGVLYSLAPARHDRPSSSPLPCVSYVQVWQNLFQTRDLGGYWFLPNIAFGFMILTYTEVSARGSDHPAAACLCRHETTRSPSVWKPRGRGVSCAACRVVKRARSARQTRMSFFHTAGPRAVLQEVGTRGSGRVVGSQHAVVTDACVCMRRVTDVVIAREIAAAARSASADWVTLDRSSVVAVRCGGR